MDLKNDDEVKKLIERAFNASKGDLKERIASTTKDIQDLANSQLGSGVYVKGILNPDAGGVSFRFKQPAIARRIECFVSVSQEDMPADDAQTTMSLDDKDSSGEPQDDDEDNDDEDKDDKKSTSSTKGKNKKK